MSLRRSGGNVKVQIDGVLVVDKPDGITSMDVVRTGETTLHGQEGRTPGDP